LSGGSASMWRLKVASVDRARDRQSESAEVKIKNTRR